MKQLAVLPRSASSGSKDPQFLTQLDFSALAPAMPLILPLRGKNYDAK